MNLTGHFLDQQSINITWTRVPKGYRQGTIEGYKLYYADKTLSSISWHTIIISNRHGGGDNFNQTVKGLKTYTPYLFKISAFTYRAEGALSDNLTVWTDEYGMYDKLWLTEWPLVPLSQHLGLSSCFISYYCKHAIVIAFEIFEDAMEFISDDVIKIFS